MKDYPQALPAGSVLAGQYVIEGVLGQGGFGITYVARDHKSGQELAVKEFFPDGVVFRNNSCQVSCSTEEYKENFDLGKESFLQEAMTLSDFIGNENIVRVYSYFEENGTAYFVMEYIRGQSLQHYLKEHGNLSFEEACRIFFPIMDALAAVHEKGIVHRDVAPDNIYLTEDKGVKLLDFGAARYSIGDRTKSLDVVLKRGFAPFEQYSRNSRQGPFTDIYALGASFYFSLTGTKPPDAVDRVNQDMIQLPSALGVVIPPEAEQVLLKALAVQSSERYSSMYFFRKDLEEIYRFYLDHVVESGISDEIPGEQPLYEDEVLPGEQTGIPKYGFTETMQEHRVPELSYENAEADMRRPVPGKKGRYGLIFLFAFILISAVIVAVVVIALREPEDPEKGSSGKEDVTAYTKAATPTEISAATPTEAAPTPVEAAACSKVRVKSGKMHINVRTTPVNGGVIAAVDGGDIFDMEGSQTGSDGSVWYLISGEKENKYIRGYIRGDMVEVIEAEEDSADTSEYPTMVMGSILAMDPPGEWPEFPESFTDTRIRVGDRDVMAWTDEQYFVFYATSPTGYVGWVLYDSAEGRWVRYNEDLFLQMHWDNTVANMKKALEDRQEPTDQEGNGSILAMEPPENYPLWTPKSFEQTRIRVGNREVTAWADKTYYIFYGVSPIGNVGWFLYDSAEGRWVRYLFY
ncbi:MAG: serine/threonine protein kinase [Lachnospiraceae bacterium]|nr:serine/threonine protein kinase [Lachnospiraceae bacterium]